MNRLGLAALAALGAIGMAAIIFMPKDAAATRVTIACEARLSPEDLDKAADAGLPVSKVLQKDGGLVPKLLNQYPTFLIGTWKNPDGGIVYPSKLDFGEILDLKTACVEVGNNVPADAIQPSQFRCACTTGSNCTVGGQPAPRGVTLAAGTFTGSGCEPKSCGPERAGEQGATWPAECPQK